MYTLYAAFGIWAVLNLIFFACARYSDAATGNVTGRDNLVSCIPGLAICTLFLALFGGAAVATQLATHVPLKTVTARTSELASMRSAGSLQANIYLGCGMINGYTVYQIYVKNTDGTMSPDRVWADTSTKIKEDASLHDRGYLRQIEIVPDFSSPLAKWALLDRSDDVVSSWYEFDLPEGTVVQNFSLK